jgi:P27 family predicted phage terminase small subunit
MVEAQERLSKSGLLLKSPNSDYIQQSPLISIVNKNAELVLKLSREFGLTPASRSRLHAEGGSEKKGSGLLNGDWDKRAG